MNPDLSEVVRTLANLIRIGVIAEVQGDRARVQLSPTLFTTWLRWIAARAGNDQTWWAPSVGEQVIVLSPDGDLTKGRILPGLYSQEFPAPESNHAVQAQHYRDGAVIRYDADAHALTAILPGGSTATVKADAITSDATQTTCTGDVTIKGNLIVEGTSALNNGVTVKGGAGGAAMKINGSVEATEDVKAGDISLRSHPHGEVQRGNDKSGGPLP